MISIYATIDTNVIVSALLKPGSNPGLIIKYIKEGYIIPLVHDQIINEYEEVLQRDKFKFNINIINEIIGLFTQKGKYINPKEFIALEDKSDEIFYAITMSANEENDIPSYLITGNTKHFPVNPVVITPTTAVLLVNTLFIYSKDISA